MRTKVNERVGHLSQETLKLIVIFPLLLTHLSRRQWSHEAAIKRNFIDRLWRIYLSHRINLQLWAVQGPTVAIVDGPEDAAYVEDTDNLIATQNSPHGSSCGTHEARDNGRVIQSPFVPSSQFHPDSHQQTQQRPAEKQCRRLREPGTVTGSHNRCKASRKLSAKHRLLLRF